MHTEITCATVYQNRNEPSPISLCRLLIKSRNMNDEKEGVVGLSLRQWGYLNKKNHRDPGGRKAKDRHWQTFWVELCDRQMRFFRDTSLSANSSRKTPPWSLRDSESANLQLAGFRTLNMAEAFVDYTLERDHTFKLKANGAETFYQAPSMASMLNWIGALNEVSEMEGYGAGGGVESEGKIESLVVKLRREQLRDERKINRVLASQSTFESDDDLFDYDLPKDPRVVCLEEQIRQRYALWRLLEEEEKAFLDQAAVGKPEAFQRCHFVATVAKKYYLVPGHEGSVLKPGSKVTVYGKLPNGRWRCSAQKEGFHDIYGDANGEPGLTIKVNENQEDSLDNVRLSIMSEPGAIRERDSSHPRHNTSPLLSTVSVKRPAAESSNTPEIIIEEPSENDVRKQLSSSASNTSISDDDLIAQSRQVKHGSVITKGKMLPGLQRRLTASGDSSPNVSPPLPREVVKVLVQDGLFRGEHRSVSPVVLRDTENGDSSETYTIYQSTVRKTFPLIGSIPSSLVWEFQEAASSKTEPPSPESNSSPEHSPAPSPITSPIIMKNRHLVTNLFASPKMKRQRERDLVKSMMLPNSDRGLEERKPRANTVGERLRTSSSSSPTLSPPPSLLRGAISDGSMSPRTGSPRLSRWTSCPEGSGFQILRKIRKRGMSLVIGESSSSSSSEEETEGDNASQANSVEHFLKYDDGQLKNQAGNSPILPRSSRTLVQSDRPKASLKGFSSLRKEPMRQKSSTLPINPSRSSSSEFRSPSDSPRGQSPSRGFLGLFTKRTKSKSPARQNSRPDSDIVEEPKLRLSEPEVRPPMNQRRTLLLEKSDKGWGFKVETCGSEKSQKRTYIVEVVEDMPAFYGGLRPGDVILEINGEEMEFASHEVVVSKLKSSNGPVRIAVKFVDGVKLIKLQRQFNILQHKLREKQSELWRIIEKEMEILGELTTDDEESTGEEGDDEEDGPEKNT
eukprot:m.119129 g.119129  ORF g.119129 m.119129 type:complete len:962 (+) comp37673_c1_seq1:80-2965(+)